MEKQDYLYNASNSVFLKEREFYNSELKKNKNPLLKCCATCATLYNRNELHINGKTNIVQITNESIFILFDKKAKYKNKYERVDKTLLYGTSLRHTDSILNFTHNMNNQFNLLLEAYSLLLKGLSDKPSGDTLILYIKMTNPVENSKYLINTQKCTHPHVWIVDSLPTYTGIKTKYEKLSTDTISDFFTRMINISSNIIVTNPSEKVYLKFLINSSNNKIIHSEIDIDC